MIFRGSGESRISSNPLLRSDLSVVLVDSVARIVAATPRAKTLLGLPDKMGRAIAFDSLLSPRNPAWIYPQIRKSALAGSWVGDLIIRRSNESESWIHLQACPEGQSSSGKNRILMILEDVSDQVELINRLLERSEELYDRNRELEVLNKIGKLMLNESDLDELLNTILEEAAVSVGADSGAFLLCDQGKQALVCRCTFGSTPRDFIGTALPYEGESFTVCTVKSGKTAWTPDLSQERGSIANIAFRHNIRAGICVPMMVDGEAIGALILGYKEPRREFPAQEITLVEIITSQAASAIRSALLADGIEQLHINWQRTLDACDSLVTVTDLDGRVLLVNNNFADLLKVTAADVVGQKIHRLIPDLPPDLARVATERRHSCIIGRIPIAGELYDVGLQPFLDGQGRLDVILLYAMMAMPSVAGRSEPADNPMAA